MLQRYFNWSLFYQESSTTCLHPEYISYFISCMSMCVIMCMYMHGCAYTCYMGVHRHGSQRSIASVFLFQSLSFLDSFSAYLELVI